MTSPSVTAAAALPGWAADRLRPVAAVLGAVALAAALGSDEGVVLCPYRRCTGGDCPLCGGTRAAGALLRGDVAGSWARHPLVPILALQVAIGAVVAGIARRRGRDLRRWRPLVQRVLLANLALAVAIWVVRLASGAVAGPAYLAPPF
ncbi:MAG: DUF2752 domain-containing protein [Actinomycetota bacterium]